MIQQSKGEIVEKRVILRCGKDQREGTQNRERRLGSEFKEAFPIKPEEREVSRSYPCKAEGGEMEVDNDHRNVKQE